MTRHNVSPYATVMDDSQLTGRPIVLAGAGPYGGDLEIPEPLVTGGKKWADVDRAICMPAEQFPTTADAEWALLTKIADFSSVVASGLNQRTCAPIANYTLELARLFSSFYNDCPVLKAENEALVTARLQICKATLQTLKNALGILGIAAPERM